MKTFALRAQTVQAFFRVAMPHHHLHVLLVENSENDAERIIQALQREGLQPSWQRVQSEESLKLALADRQCDIVLSDSKIPGLHAETTLQVVHSWNLGLPVIIVSEAIGEESAVDLIRAGASDFVRKDHLARLPAAISRIVDVNGEGAGAMGLSRKQAEAEKNQALNALNERVNELTALHQAATCLRKASLTLEEALREFVEILPLAFRDPERRSGRIVLGPEEVQTRGFRESSWRLSSELLLADGRTGWIEVFSQKSPAQDVEGLFPNREQQVLDSLAEILSSFLNRKEAEDLLFASEQRYRLLVETIPHMIWMTDPEGRVNSLNPRAEKALGVPAESLFGWKWLGIVHPEDRTRARKFKESLSHSGSDYRNEFRMRVADGSDRWFLVQGMPLYGKEGTVERWIGSLTDIDDLKTSEAGRKRTSELLKAVADNATDAIFVKDSQGRYLLFNAAAARFVGRSIEEALGQDDAALFRPEDARFLRERDLRVMATGEAETQEECLTAAGVTRTYLATKAPYRDEHGHIIGTIGISRDITDRKQAEEALRASEERFRAFMDNSPAVAWITDPQGRFIYSSALFSRTMGLPWDNLSGHLMSEVFPEEQAEVCLRNTRTVAETGEVLETIEPALRADGTTGEFLVYKFPLTDSQGQRIVGGVAVDVTERRKMEEALRLRDRAMGAATQGIVITDALQPENPVIYVSPGVERLTGYASSELLGKSCRLLQGPETDPETRDRLREAVAAGKPCTVEIRNYRKEGTPFWNHLCISPVRDAEGRLTHFVGVQSDVTQRRHLEEQIRQSQKMEAIGQLAGGIAHDFNNLLTIINGYAGILWERTPTEDPNHDPLQEICKAGERSEKLTRQLLAFSRRQILALEILDLNAIVSKAERLLERLIGGHIEMVTLLASEPLPVKADAGQIEQILLNLAVNARDAMPSGGQLTLETQTVELKQEQCGILADIPAGVYAMLSVIDTGCGMSQAVRSRIFEPFFTTKKDRGGTGLGLSVVHGIVTQSGGHVEISSEEGVGTTFKILLPLAPEGLPSKTRQRKCDSQSLPGGTETILLVEDEPGVRTFAKQTLEKCGYLVLDAMDGAEAMRLLGTFLRMFKLPIHLLVTDVVMPHESGFQIAERLRKEHPELPVIFISGYTDDTVLRHGVRNSEVNFLQKPFSSFELARKVRAVLDKVGVAGFDLDQPQMEVSSAD